MDNTDNELLDILRNKKSAGIEELAEELFISPSTVRRRLESLQKKGLVTRTHGGAKIVNEHNFFPLFNYRANQNSVEKKQIALSAIELIKNGDVIFLDGSSTAFFIAELLTPASNVKVVTNGIDTISLLSHNGIEAYSTGGMISPVNRAVLVGHHAEQTVKKFYADIAFISARSVTPNGEVYDVFEEENVLRLCMLERAKKIVFLCDGTKLGRTSPYRLCSVEDFDCIVCDKNITGYFEGVRLPEIIYR